MSHKREKCSAKPFNHVKSKFTNKGSFSTSTYSDSFVLLLFVEFEVFSSLTDGELCFKLSFNVSLDGLLCISSLIGVLSEVLFEILFNELFVESLFIKLLFVELFDELLDGVLFIQSLFTGALFSVDGAEDIQEFELFHSFTPTGACPSTGLSTIGGT
jgi:hypothetical protein